MLADFQGFSHLIDVVSQLVKLIVSWNFTAHRKVFMLNLLDLFGQIGKRVCNGFGKLNSDKQSDQCNRQCSEKQHGLQGVGLFKNLGLRHTDNHDPARGRDLFVIGNNRGTIIVIGKESSVAL
ncbi:hypothetical protein SDC9_208440 [bioreactor metagenome]|uniref:Uncharacterized protein n=1 Tax=bioreactor metagenome TaxID=1076179 RepID=A0A645JDG6_9ZZZZ